MGGPWPGAADRGMGGRRGETRAPPGQARPVKRPGFRLFLFPSGAHAQRDCGGLVSLLFRGSPRSPCWRSGQGPGPAPDRSCRWAPLAGYRFRFIAGRVGEDGPHDLTRQALVAVFFAAADQDRVRDDLVAAAGGAAVAVIAGGHAAPSARRSRTTSPPVGARSVVGWVARAWAAQAARSMISASVRKADLTRRGMPSSARSHDTPRACGSISVAEYPALAHPWPRMVSEDASVEQRNAHRYPNRSRRLVGMMSALGRWVASTGMIPGARPRATTSRVQALNSFCSAGVPTVAEY